MAQEISQAKDKYNVVFMENHFSRDRSVTANGEFILNKYRMTKEQSLYFTCCEESRKERVAAKLRAILKSMTFVFALSRFAENNVGAVDLLHSKMPGLPMC